MEKRGPFAFRVAEAQVVGAMRRHMLSRFGKGVGKWLLILFAFVLALLLIADMATRGAVSGEGIAFAAALPLVLAAAWFVFVPMTARRQYRQSAALRDECQISWDDEAVEFRSSRGQARLPFAEFHDWSDAGEVIVLYQTEAYFNIVPKAPLGDAAGDLMARLAASRA